MLLCVFMKCCTIVDFYNFRYWKDFSSYQELQFFKPGLFQFQLSQTKPSTNLDFEAQRSRTHGWKQGCQDIADPFCLICKLETKSCLSSCFKSFQYFPRFFNFFDLFSSYVNHSESNIALVIILWSTDWSPSLKPEWGKFKESAKVSCYSNLFLVKMIKLVFWVSILNQLLIWGLHSEFEASL